MKRDEWSDHYDDAALAIDYACFHLEGDLRTFLLEWVHGYYSPEFKKYVHSRIASEEE